MSRTRQLIVLAGVAVVMLAITGGLLIITTDVLAPVSLGKPSSTPTATLALPDPTDALPAGTAVEPTSTFVLLPPATTTKQQTIITIPDNLTPSTTPMIVTLAPTGANTSTATSTPITIAEQPTATYTPLPLVAQSNPADFREHFIMARPLAADYTNFASRNYPYGSTASRTLQVHHGIDINNPTGTPVRAVADGTVYYAGDDLNEQFGPHLNFYGKLVIIDHGQMPNGQQIYSVYGHLSEIFVQTGQPVDLYQTVGAVGSTGVAQGSHLHFEVRLDDPLGYFATRNPDLWLQNWNGFGVLAGRVVDSQGNKLPDIQIEIRSPSLGAPRVFNTYADVNLAGDDILDENFAYGDLPVGDYEIIIKHPGGKYEDTFGIYADRVTWLEIELPY